MIYVNKKAKDIFNALNDNNYYVVMDFDRTLTNSSSKSTWDLLSFPNILSKDYIREADNYYNYYAPLEFSVDIDFLEKSQYMNEWWTKHLELFKKYKLREDVFDKIVLSKNIMDFREGAITFLNYLYKKRIPVIIISAGIGNFIDKFLEINNCKFDNIYVFSNYLKFKNGLFEFNNDLIVHSLNKNVISIPDDIKRLLNKKHYRLLFGDQVEDIKMVDDGDYDSTIRVGFLKDNKLEYYKKYFDIIIDDESNYNDFLKLMV